MGEISAFVTNVLKDSLCGVCMEVDYYGIYGFKKSEQTHSKPAINYTVRPAFFVAKNARRLCDETKGGD